MDNFTYNKFQSEALKIFWITAGWTVISVFQFYNVYFTILDLNLDLPEVNAKLLLQTSVLSGVLAGIFGGSTVVLLWEEWLRNKTYGWALFSIFLSFTMLFVAVSFVSGLFLHSNKTGLTIFVPEVWAMVAGHFSELSTLQNYFFWLFIVLSTLLVLQVNDK